MAIVTLIEAQPWDPATGVVVPVRLAGGGRRHYRHKGFADWRAGVIAPPRLTELLEFDGGFTGGAIPSTSAIGFLPARDAVRAAIARLMWVGAPITVSTGDDDDASPAWTVELAGTVAGYNVQRGGFTFTVANLAGALDKPLVTATFAGTGGVEGDASAAGRLKRRSWGRCWNVEGRLLDAASHIYEFGDPACPIAGFDQVKDKGRYGPLATVGWQGTIAATFAALKAAVAPAGGAAVAPSIACAKWWTQPSVITADLRGEIGSGYAETVAGIAAAVSLAAGGPDVIELAAAIAARPDPAGLHVDEAGERGVAILDRLLLRASMAWSIAPAGGLSLAPLAFADPVRTIAGREVEREAAFAPATSVRVGWRRNHRVLAAGDISAAVIAGDVTFEDGQSLESLKPATAGATAGAPAGTTIGGTVQADGSVTGGVAAAQLVQQLARIDPIEADLSALDRAVIDLDAARRQVERDAGRIDETLLRLVAESGHTRQVLRDAGFVVDPATGIVRVYAIDQLADRTAQAELMLDAQRGLISQKASVDQVHNLIAAAVLNPEQVAKLEPIIARLASAESRIDGLNASVALKADLVALTRLDSTVSTVAADLDALAGAVRLKAEKSVVDALAADVGAAQLSLQALGDLSSYSVTVRQARAIADDGAESALRALIAGDAAKRSQIAQAAEVRQEMIAKVEDARSADAGARQSLVAQMAESDARAVRETSARVAGDAAQAADLSALRAVVNDASTGLPAVAAGVARSDQAIAELKTATATSIGQVSATIGDVSGRVDTLSEVVVGPDGGTARAVMRLDVNGRVSGTVQTNDGTTSAFGVVADGFGVFDSNGKRVFYVDTDGAIAASFQQSAIGYDNLEMGAAQRAAWYKLSQDAVIQRGATVQVVSVTFDKVDTDSALEVMFFANLSSPDDMQISGSIAVDGVSVQPVSINVILVGGDARMPVTPFAFVEGIAAGRHTVTFTLTNTETDNVPLTVQAGSTLKVVELRKASLGSVSGSGAVDMGGGSGSGGGGGYRGGGSQKLQ